VHPAYSEGPGRADGSTWAVRAQAVTAPAEIASTLQLEAHTKLVLVNLILEGKVSVPPCPPDHSGSSYSPLQTHPPSQPFSYPAYLSPAVQKMIREQAKPYETVVGAFHERNAAAIWTMKPEDFTKVRLTPTTPYSPGKFRSSRPPRD
jgi:hypothetical protein